MPEFATPQPIDATIDIPLGDVRVAADDRPDTVVTVLPGDPDRAADVAAAAATHVDLTDGRLTVRGPRPRKLLGPFDRDGSIVVTVALPTGSSVAATTAMGDVRIDGEVGRCRARTGMGALRLDRTGPLHARTGFGDVDVDEIDGDADVTTGSGQVRVGRAGGTLVVKNANGPTAVDAVLGDLRVKASNGDIAVGRAGAGVVAKTALGTIQVGALRRGVAVLETAAGNVSCGVTAGTAAHLDVRSRYGRVTSELDATDGPAPSDEVLELRAHTSAGDITLTRAEPHGALPT